MDRHWQDADFRDAMDRHWQDAELLYKKDRLANAEHLYGLSAECGLKAVMQCCLDMEMENNMPPKDDRKHINDGLWDRYESYREGRGARFSLPWQDDSFPFEDWNISHRYANRAHFGEDRLKKHRSGAEDVRKLVANLEKEGLLP
ncbi:hypothetical protein BO91_02155 [Candidatus Synechococcus spongiarum LMB bulk10E]|nr:hypothetical protein BO91_02155 [Candidatus Synechococcus spongiarum LMB bulk10E]